MRRTYEILIVIIIFIWCTALIYLSRNQDSMLERSNHERNDLDKAFAAIEELQRQNNQLKKIAQNLNAVGVVPINESESKNTNLRNLRLRLQACLQNVESITKNTGHHLGNWLTLFSFSKFMRLTKNLVHSSLRLVKKNLMFQIHIYNGGMGEDWTPFHSIFSSPLVVNKEHSKNYKTVSQGSHRLLLIVQNIIRIFG
uniref:Uncharacterized protein n=1 Tax=Ciona intestinalis TaxID=7719 RepID=H2XZV6_CIOIN